MNKIGICACYTNHNYGSMLQSYATQKIFEAEGFDCEMIRYKKKKSFVFLLKQIPRLLNRITISDKKLVVKKKLNLRKHPEAARENLIRDKAFERFQNKYFIKLSPEYYGYKALKVGALNYIAVVSGSDQVWSPSALATHFYDLNFVPDHVLKVSYASSFGVQEIPFYQIKRTKKFLNRIEHISVREVSAQKIIKDLVHKNVPVVCDPTFLFTAEQWGKLIPKKGLISEPYIFAYFLGSSLEYRKAVCDFAHQIGLKIVAIHHMDTFVPADQEFGDIVLSDVGPEEFVNLIRDASYICTDSFHGTIFSVLHHKQFVVFNRYNNEAKDSKNSRIDSICKILNVSDRRFHGDLTQEIQKPINYNIVDQHADKFRSSSLEYIHNVVEKLRENND